MVQQGFDKNVMECMWILLQNYHVLRLEEFQRKEASQRNKSEKEGTKNVAKDHQGEQEWSYDLLSKAWSWNLESGIGWKLHLGHQETYQKIGKNSIDKDGNPGRNFVCLIDWFWKTSGYFELAQDTFNCSFPCCNQRHSWKMQSLCWSIWCQILVQ